MASMSTWRFGALTTLLVLGVSSAAHASKPDQTAPWSCMITFDSTLLDPNGPSTPIPTAVQSDGAGPYIDGSQGVSCFVDATTTDLWSSGRLFLQPSSKSPRYLLIPGQTAVNAYTESSYPTMQIRQAGYFEVWAVGSVTVGQTVRRLVRVGPGGTLFRGDSTATDPVMVGSSSAWVSRISVCSWRIVWYPWAPLEAGENAYPPSYPTVPRVISHYAVQQNRTPATRLADYPLPLAATVTLINGSQGCN